MSISFVESSAISFLTGLGFACLPIELSRPPNADSARRTLSIWSLVGGATYSIARYGYGDKNYKINAFLGLMFLQMLGPVFTVIHLQNEDYKWGDVLVGSAAMSLLMAGLSKLTSSTAATKKAT